VIEQAREIVAILAESDLSTRLERSAFVARLRDKHGLKFKNIGRQLNVSRQRAGQLYGLNKLLRDMKEAVDWSAPATAGEVMEKVIQFFNRSGFVGQFKMWPRGTFLGEEGNYDFTMTVSDFMGDAWKEKWRVFRHLDLMLENMGYRYEVSGSKTFHFYPT
jgi:hypothetical protein